MRAHTTKARLEAVAVLQRHGIVYPAVDVEHLARREGIIVQRRAFDDDLSGMAFVKAGAPVIGVNSTHHINRQRFSLAHELGHVLLHRSRITEELHVDRLNRDAKSAAGVDPVEIEANAFASELLMPREWVVQSAGDDWDAHDDELVSRLAQEFRVSTAAINNRLSSLL